MRGEYGSRQDVGQRTPELPPRARRIPIHGSGTVSGERNYLRVRGEYTPEKFIGTYPLELPPRARRIPCLLPPSPRRFGTTSACAENTGRSGFRGSAAGNYLRVRGEYIVLRFGDAAWRELPPRARRIRSATVWRMIEDGTTSACAENT